MQKPTPFYLRKAESAYDFFRSMEALNTSFTIDDVVQATGYKASVVTRYIRMKWGKWFIMPVGDGTYRCTNAIYNQNKEFFIKQLSQSIDSSKLLPSPHLPIIEPAPQPIDTTSYIVFIAALLIIAAFYKVSYRWRYALYRWYWKQWWSMWWPLVV